MNLTDIIALARQGYKPSDIKELISLEIPEPEPAPEPAAEAPAAPEPAPEPEDKTDYKSLYEAEKEKVAKLQSNNVKASAGEVQKEIDEFEIVSNLFKNI